MLQKNVLDKKETTLRSMFFRIIKTMLVNEKKNERWEVLEELTNNTVVKKDSTELR